MSYNNFYMRLRVKAVQEFDKMYYEPEYKAKCHKRVWERLGRYTPWFQKVPIFLIRYKELLLFIMFLGYAEL